MDVKQALLRSIASILDDTELTETSRSVALLDTVRQFVVWTGANVGYRTDRGAPPATTFVDRQSDDIRLAGLHKSDIYEKMKTLSTALRQSGETPEAAFARFAETPSGSALYKAYKMASAGDLEPVDRAVIKIDESEAMRKMRAAAETLRARDPRLSKEMAFAKAYEHPENRALVAAIKAENRGLMHAA